MNTSNSHHILDDSEKIIESLSKIHSEIAEVRKDIQSVIAPKFLSVSIFPPFLSIEKN